MTKPYCPGTNCPLTGSCARFKKYIDVKKEIHFSEAPYNHTDKKCGHFIKEGETDGLLKRVLDIENDGNQN